MNYEVTLPDWAINENKNLRLSTTEWYVRHMGNSVPDELAEQIGKNPAEAKRRSSILRRGIFRKVVQWVYDMSFKILYRN